MHLSIVVLTHDRAPLLKRCLKSIEDDVGASAELIVAANAPDTATEDVLRNFQPARVLRFPENIGAEARNRAAQEARGRLILFLDDDCLVHPGMSRALAECFEDPSVAAAGPYICSDREPGRLIAIGHTVGRLSGRVRGVLPQEPAAAVEDVPMVGANGMMIRRDLFRRLGGFSPEYFVFFEDSDLCERIKSRGFRIVASSDARMGHPESKGSDAPMLLQRMGIADRTRGYLLARNRTLFMRRNRSVFGFLVFACTWLPLYTAAVALFSWLTRRHDIATAYLGGSWTALKAARSTGRVRPFVNPDPPSVRAYNTALSWTDPIVRSVDPDTQTVLDVGSGSGQPLDIINRRKRFFSIGVDSFEPYLSETRKRGIHTAVVKANALKLPFADQSFDTVLCLQVIEHLEKHRGSELLEELERVARRQLIVTTPNGFMPHPEVDGNPHQVHLSGWTPAEMRALGFDVEKQGLKQLYGERGMVHRIRIGPIRKAVFVLGWLFEACCRFLPPVRRCANYYIICTKRTGFAEGEARSNLSPRR